MGLDLTAVRDRMLAGIRASTRDALQSVFPPRCIACGEDVGSEFGLCGPCWREMNLITGAVCACCGAPLPGEAEATARCDDCLRAPRPWSRGRAAMLYSGTGRRLILSFKHHDRHDLLRPLSAWLGRAAAPLIEPDMVLAPVPLHRLRLIKRRFNQSAMLAQAIARQAGIACVPDLFIRTRHTPSQEGLNRAERAQNLAGAIAVAPRRAQRILGRHVLIVDDVLTSGATMGAAAEAALAAGAAQVSVVALARVAKDG